ncbi:hypothetical protein C2W62_38495 [Candidatus Entotheonella serta]|nr:hypothetical protein C2W62_38495 [Candidatus Entotheonella serta]
MVQQLYQAGATIGAVILLDAMVPNGNPVDPMDEVELMLLYEHLMREEGGLEPMLSETRLTPLSSEGRLQLFKQSLEEAGIYPRNSPLELIRGIINVAAADHAALDYVPTDFVSLPLHLFLATEGCDKQAQQGMIAGWSCYGDVRVHEVPGSHTTMMYAPHVSVLAEELRACLQGG